MARLVQFPKTRVVSNALRTLPGAKVWIYETGTTTPLVTYGDPALSAAQTHPVVADAYGVFGPIYLSNTVASYKMRLTNNAGSEIWTEDGIPASGGSTGGGGTSTTIGIYPITDEETDLGLTEGNLNTTYPPGNVWRYGAVADGTWARAGDNTPTIGGTDNLAAFNTAAALFDHYNIVIPPGAYRLSAMWRVTCPLSSRSVIDGYGAEILVDKTETTAAIQLWQNTDPHGVTVYGITVNHRGNNTALAGFDIVGTSHCRLVDCVVEADNTLAAYAAFRIRQLVERSLGTYANLAALQTAHPTGTFGQGYKASTSFYGWNIATSSWQNMGGESYDTGAFWTTLENCSVRERSGGDPGIIGNGVRLQGSANATVIRGGSFVSCTTGVLITTEGDPALGGGDGNYIANAVLIDGAAFETVTNCIYVYSATTKPIDGLRVVNCRAEAASKFIWFSTSVFQPRIPAVVMGNYVTTNVTHHIFNSSGTPLDVVCWDSNGTEWANYPPILPKFISPWEVQFTTRSIDKHALMVQGGGGNRGIRLNSTDGTQCGFWGWSGTGTGSVLGGVSADMRLQNVKDIWFGSPNAVGISWGSGTPEGSLAAAVGSMYLDASGSTGTVLYVKETGTNTVNGWVAK